jgi:hypothetical protein
MRNPVRLVFLCISALWGTVLPAQVVPPGPTAPGPSSSECQAAAAALAGGARGAEWESLPGCGKVGGRALARALEAARHETDAAYLDRLYGNMASIKDPAVFAASLAVMQDPAASPEARATAILVAVAQHDNALSLPVTVSLKDLLGGTATSQCRLVPTSHASYRSSSPLPADYLQQLGKAMLQLKASADTPDLVRNFIECVRPATLAAVADAVPTSAIRLSYVCGNRYRVENQSTEPVKVSWAVSGIRAKGQILVPPGGAKTFTAQQRGPTTLYYRGKEVQTEPNGAQPCKRRDHSALRSPELLICEPQALRASRLEALCVYE